MEKNNFYNRSIKIQQKCKYILLILLIINKMLNSKMNDTSQTFDLSYRPTEAFVDENYIIQTR